jgi:membrane-bound ClpP family serine protease
MDQTLALTLLLIGGGLLLLLSDLFFYSGLIAIIGLVLILIGVGLPFYYGNTSTGIATLVGVLVVVPTAVYGLLQFTIRTQSGRGLMLQTGPEDDATVATMPVIAELEQLRGRIGKAVSPLRPSGTVEFDGRRIDVLSESIMVAQGTWVRCIDVKAGRVIVRPVETPQLGAGEDINTADFT